MFPWVESWEMSFGPGVGALDPRFASVWACEAVAKPMARSKAAPPRKIILAKCDRTAPFARFGTCRVELWRVFIFKWSLPKNRALNI